jgi:tripartite-type tricarboxylate transporter receptor subunit TctC
MNFFAVKLRQMTCLGMVSALMSGGSVHGEALYPSKTVRMVVPYAAGGPNDVMARVISQQWALTSGQAVVVENKVGAGGVVGTDLVAKSAADGYTLGFISAPFTMAPALQSKMPYDTLRDFTPVSKIAESPMVMLVPSTSRFKSPQELIDFAAKNPGVLNYGSGGIGSTPHLTTELLNAMLGIKLTHVPYKGGGESIKALMSGEIDVLIDSITSTDGPIASGRVKAIAIASPRRVPKMPAVPTFEESGIRNFGVTHWVGVVAPARLPAETLNSLHAQLDKALKSPEVVKRLTEIGAETAGNSPSEFARFIQSEVGNWQKAVKAAQIKVSD